MKKYTWTIIKWLFLIVAILWALMLLLWLTEPNHSPEKFPLY